MADEPTNPKIEELRAKLNADPKSRHFYPLAEELRKVGRFQEAEELLLNGLASSPGYLSAWVSLGRVLKETKKGRGAVEAFNKALTLDPGNVVVARLLAETYLSLGEKVEAIKKYKLVHALMPGDDEINERIRQLDRELNSEAGSETGGPDTPATPSAPVELPPAPVEQAPAPASVPAEAAAPTEPPLPVEEELPETAEHEAFRPSEQEGAGLFFDSTSPPPVSPAASFDSAEVEEIEPTMVLPPPKKKEDRAEVGESTLDLSPSKVPRPESVPETSERAAVVAIPPPSEEQDMLPVADEPFAEAEPSEDSALLPTVEIEPFGSETEPEEIEPETTEAPFQVGSEPQESLWIDEGIGESVTGGEHEEALLTIAPAPERLPEAEPVVSEELAVPEEPEVFEESFGGADEEEEIPEPIAAESPEEVPYSPDELTATLTMADLYAKQGHQQSAREIYERILERDPQNDDVWRKLEALGAAAAEQAAPASPREEIVRRLEAWRDKVARR